MMGDITISPNGRVIRFDSNAAGLCVAEMQKRGEWGSFHNFVWNERPQEWLDLIGFTAWLFNAENFFEALAEWRKVDD